MYKCILTHKEATTVSKPFLFRPSFLMFSRSISDKKKKYLENETLSEKLLPKKLSRASQNIYSHL